MFWHSHKLFIREKGVVIVAHTSKSNNIVIFKVFNKSYLRLRISTGSDFSIVDLVW